MKSLYKRRIMEATPLCRATLKESEILDGISNELKRLGNDSQAWTEFPQLVKMLGTPNDDMVRTARIYVDSCLEHNGKCIFLIPNSFD